MLSFGENLIFEKNCDEDFQSFLIENSKWNEIMNHDIIAEFLKIQILVKKCK